MRAKIHFKAKYTNSVGIFELLFNLTLVSFFLIDFLVILQIVLIRKRINQMLAILYRNYQISKKKFLQFYSSKKLKKSEKVLKYVKNGLNGQNM